MFVKFILPELQEARSDCFRNIKYSLFPPLGLAQLAGYLDNDDTAEIVDCHVDKADFNDAPDLVVIQTYITNAKRSYAIADAYRQRGIYVVMGGLHATSLPAEALQHADAVITGPAHQAWQDFLQKFRNDRTIRGIFSDSVRTLENLPMARRDLIDRNKYLVPNSIVVSRGCPNRCNFCYTQNFFANGKSFYTSSIDRILSEINSLPGKHLFFLDDNLLADAKFASELFTAMQGMNRRFQAAASTAAVLNEKLLDKAAQAGLRSLFIGFESINQQALIACSKLHNHVDEYNNVIKNLRDRNIMTNASFVFGLPGDTPDTFKRTVEWAVSQGVETATFHLATPYPGTPFYEAMKEQDRILTGDWDLYDTRHAVIKHDTMTPEELEKGYQQSYKDFYAWSNIWQSAGVKDSVKSRLRSFVYTAAWKKFDWLWQMIIQGKKLPYCSQILEKVLDMH